MYLYKTDNKIVLTYASNHFNLLALPQDKCTCQLHFTSSSQETENIDWWDCPPVASTRLQTSLNKQMQTGSQTQVDAEDDRILLSLGILLDDNSNKTKGSRSEKPDGSVTEYHGRFESNHENTGDESGKLVEPSSTIQKLQHQRQEKFNRDT